LTILSIPAILLSYGLFTLVVNGVILWISMKIAPNVSMSLWNSIVAGAVLSLINYAISNYIYKDLGKELE
jgi:putative membrane protein